MINDYEDQTVLVQVTREDIENGIRNSSTCCPIALAVCRALGELSENENIEVDGGIIDVYNDYDVLIRDVWLMGFIIKFDKEELVFPFEFRIQITEKEFEPEEEEE